MTDFHDLAPDCRHFRWDRPCAPHKRDGVRCPDCKQYDPIQQRLAVVKLAAVGDVLRTTALLPAIRKEYPRAAITWVTDAAAVDLFRRNPLVDEVWSRDDARVGIREFDLVLCPDADPLTAAVAASMHAKDRRGFTMDRAGRVVPIGEAADHWLRMGIDDDLKRANTQTYQRLVARVLELDPAAVGEPILVPADADIEAARGFRSRLSFAGRVVGINTGAGGRWRYKRWTVAHQKSLIASLTAAGVGVFLLGGPGEAGTHGELLVPSSPEAPVVSVGTNHDFSRFAAFVEQCDVLVTGDTMALHVACARKVPVVALFGPTSLAEIEVYGRGEKIAPEGLDCLGCYRPVCDKSPYCQELIAPETVFAAVQRLIA